MPVISNVSRENIYKRLFPDISLKTNSSTRIPKILLNY